MSGYLRIELKKFFTNRKNLAIYALIAACALFYALRVAPAYDPIEKANYDEIQAAYDTRKAFLDSRKGKDNLHAHPAVRHALFMFITWNKIEVQRMEALEKNDLKEYAKITNKWYRFADEQISNTANFYYYNPRYYAYDDPDSHQKGQLGYLSTATRYGKYALLDSKITIDVLEERTANQTIYRLLEGYLPYILYIACLLLTIDIVLQDRKNPTLLRGYPIADWKKLVVKGLTAFIGSVAVLVPMFIGYIIIAIQSGFGSLKLPIPVMIEKDYQPYFDAITLGKYFAQTGSLILGWFAVIISLVLLLSVTVRQELANLAAGVLLIFSEKFYVDKGLGYIKPVETYLPTYTEVSKVITNVKNFFYNSDGIIYAEGMKLLSLTALILLLLAISVTFVFRGRLLK